MRRVRATFCRLPVALKFSIAESGSKSQVNATPRNFIHDHMKRGTKTKTTRCKSNDFSAPNRLWGKLQETEEQPARRKRKPIEAMIKTLAQKIRPVKPKLGSAAAMIAYAMMRRRGYGLKKVARYLKGDP